VTVVVGTLGDGGQTVRRLREEHGFAGGSLDFAFIDHDKDVYLPDLLRIEAEGWLHPGSVVVADNVKFPGAPAYRSYMTDQEGTLWRTVEHHAHVEYQTLLKDLVLESEYAGRQVEGVSASPLADA
jgi:catechol O-methyltransferase